MSQLVLRDLERVLGLECGSVTDLDVGMSLGARYSAEVFRRPAPGAERLAAALGERMSEILDPDELSVTVDGEYLSLDGNGGSMGGPIGLALRLPLPAEDRLREAVRGWLEGVVEFMTITGHSAWPGPGAEPLVIVTPDAVHAGWTLPGNRPPALALRPIERAELGL